MRIDDLPDGRHRLTAKQRPGGAEPRPNGVERPRELVRMLTPKEVQALSDLLSSKRFFEVSPSGCWGGVDGAEWIFEGQNPSTGYQYRRQWSPDDGLEYDLGLFLLGLTGWNVAPIY